MILYPSHPSFASSEKRILPSSHRVDGAIVAVGNFLNLSPFAGAHELLEGEPLDPVRTARKIEKPPRNSTNQ